jgi:dipeptidyl-peptidase-3
MKHDFQYIDESFADVQLLHYKVEGFDELTLQQKELIYYLSEAALYGRDILFDQNGKYNLRIRKMLEAIYMANGIDKETENYKALEVYLKRIWFSNGIHHHYSYEKFTPGFSADYLRSLIKMVDPINLPLEVGQDVGSFCDEIFPVIFDSTIDAKRVNQSESEDLLLTSASNYYDGVSQSEAEAFYQVQKDYSDKTPVMYGLNSRLVKEDGILKEQVWKSGGLYSDATDKILYWLKKAKTVAENEKQIAVIQKLIEFYETGNLKLFDEYSILWVDDVESHVDFNNGFIETYGDPLGYKASWESIVNFKDLVATYRTKIISENAQWFEDHSPVNSRFKKKEVKGVSAKVITAAILSGDLYPASAIGINLPNSDWIRSVHGSKSVTIGNLTEALKKAAHGNGFMKEFVYSQKELELIDKYNDLTDDLHTDLHECLGHGSGMILPSTDPDALKSYGATIEEARADLFGLYYMADSKLVDLNLLPDSEAYKAQYYTYMMNGLMTQLVRIDLGKELEEAHMRNRALIAYWVYEHGKENNVVEFVKKDSKTYVRINDYAALRSLFGDLLAEIQRIKSEGDYETAKRLVEKYAVKINPVLHKEVKERYEKLNLTPYKGFVNPQYIAEWDSDGKLKDVKITYREGFTEQMLRYGKEYSILPPINK